MSPDRETPKPPLDEQEWNQLRQWIEDETGMNLSGSRFPRLQDAVARVLRSFGSSTWQQLRANPDEHASFLERLTGELTVGETFFFRNEHHFEALRRHVLPALLEANRDHRSLRIWHAGCATGEEPYSMAILLDELLGDESEWEVSILATDLNPVFLDHARRGHYRAWSFRLTKVQDDPKYFTLDGNGYRLDERLRSSVRFEYLNLVKDVYPSALTGTLGLDLILFRNVAIYLDPDVTGKILDRLRLALRPGGWLLVGETEVGLVPREKFVPTQFDRATFFRRDPDELALEFRTEHPAPVLVSHYSAGTVSLATPPRVSEPKPTDHVPRSTDRDVRSKIETKFADSDFDGIESLLVGVADPVERSALRLEVVRSLLALSEGERSRRELEACLAENPLLLEAHLLTGRVHEEAGDLGEAESSYRKALYLDRNCAIAHFHLAMIQSRRGDEPGSERSLRTAAKLAQNKDVEMEVEYGEGVCYGRFREMLGTFLSSGDPSTS